MRGYRSKQHVPIILMYHRVAAVDIDPWSIAVDPKCFAEQLEIISRLHTPLSLATFVDRLGSGTLPDNAIVLTFDDGYVDNLTDAHPLLCAADIPATIFIPTGFVGQRSAFWWDELARFVLAEWDGRSFAITARGRTITIPGTDPADRSLPDPTGSTDREQIHRDLYNVLRPMHSRERQDVMEQIRILCGGKGLGTSGRPMSVGEIQTLTNDGPWTIGAHSVTHPLLADIELNEAAYEIEQSRRACAALSDMPIDGFAYPYGSFDGNTCELVKQAGFRYACSTVQMAVSSSSPLLSLPRLQVPNLGGDAFEQWLADCATSELAS